MSPTANPVTSSSGPTSPATSTAVATDPLASESTFLTLLVSQLQNQDPLNPTDSTQFVSQLTSYSQLEQLINIDQNTTPATAGSTSTSSTNSTTGV
jgi:flagellar basal-body rod modification protein FlgD